VRIAQVIQTIDFTGGGTSTAFLNTLSALEGCAGAVGGAREIHVHAYAQAPAAGDPSGSRVERDRDRWTLASCSSSSVSAGPLGRAVAAGVLAGKHDVVHMHGLWSPDLLAAAQACHRAGVPLFWEPHGMLIREAYAQKRWKKELFMLLGLRSALSRAAGLIFVTREERDHSRIPSAVSPERRHVVALPVDVPIQPIDLGYRARARQRFGVPPSAPAVVFMGRLHPVKRVEMCLEALALDHGVGDESMHLLLVGGGEEPYVASLKARAEALGIGQRVHFVGWVKGDDKWLSLAAGDVLTLNSVHENFGYVAPEAMCVGTIPVLTSNLAIAGDLASAGVGITAAPTSAGLLAGWCEAIGRSRRAWASSDDRTLAEARCWVERELSGAAIGMKLLGIYAGDLRGQSVTGVVR
jgi:glycosyltransferase involved in cell wall biosynthesis